ncbi:Hypothetical_protein [Hexamita inflata]|uniref:Hypothetical_protein n=1 Tax=Hexamita inflata TaxID=28002 RepID=A0AA86RJU7_9EUKA|nr:Hypothetical protein HINF_LOCUS63461 [Hexamita inflata]
MKLKRRDKKKKLRRRDSPMKLKRRDKKKKLRRRDLLMKLKRRDLLMKLKRRDKKKKLRRRDSPMKLKRRDKKKKPKRRDLLMKPKRRDKKKKLRRRDLLMKLKRRDKKKKPNEKDMVKRTKINMVLVQEVVDQSLQKAHEMIKRIKTERNMKEMVKINMVKILDRVVPEDLSLIKKILEMITKIKANIKNENVYNLFKIVYTHFQSIVLFFVQKVVNGPKCLLFINFAPVMSTWFKPFIFCQHVVRSLLCSDKFINIILILENNNFTQQFLKQQRLWCYLIQ